MKPIRSRMRAVSRDALRLGNLAFHEIDLPIPKQNESLVRVVAMSVGYDEVSYAMASEHQASGGNASLSNFDLAGMVEVPASDGSGPPTGTRVAGLVCKGAWAQFAIVPTDALVAIPPSISFAQAAAIPTAGLTALYGLEQGGLLAAKQVLVTCATGEVGLFAVQLGHLAGAKVTAVTAMEEHDALLEEYGADHVIVRDVTRAASVGPYHLVLTNVFGVSDLEPALTLVRDYGTCVLYGTADTAPVKIDERNIIDRSIRLYGLTLFNELRRKPAFEGLQRLFALAADRALQPHIDIEDPWTHLASVAQRVLRRDLIGRAVLRL